MKTYLNFYDSALWLAIVAGQWILAAWAIRRQMLRSSRWFTVFLSFVAAQSTLLLCVSQFLPYAAYFWSFYAGAAIESILLVFWLHEVFLTVFAPLNSLRRGVTARIFTSIALCAIAVATFALCRPATRPDAIAALARTLHRSTALVVAISLWSVVMYARSEGIPWRSRTALIAKGLLLSLSTQSVIVTVMGFTPQTWWAPLNRMSMCFYLVSLGIWFKAILTVEPEVELPAPASLLKLRNPVAQLRSITGKLAVQGKTRWNVE